MQERRRQERKILTAYTQVFDLYAGHFVGHLADLNLLGAMVIGSKPLADGMEFTAAIELPDLPEVSTARITLPVRLTWCKPDISPEYFNLGLEFREVTPAQKKIIEAVIENYEFRRDAGLYPPVLT